jgi:HPt (histidine-containing phosphotransfer) domain-containing protein
MLERCGGDRSFAAAVSERFRTQAVEEVARVERALDAADADTMRRNAHNLKSMAGYMGARTAAELSKQVEQLARENRLGDAAPVVAQLRREIERAVECIRSNVGSNATLCA